jgi:hypothetical protein
VNILVDGTVQSSADSRVSRSDICGARGVNSRLHDAEGGEEGIWGKYVGVVIEVARRLLVNPTQAEWINPGNWIPVHVGIEIDTHGKL